MEKAGNMMGSDKIAHKGAEKRSEAGGYDTMSGGYDGSNTGSGGYNQGSSDY